jgi:hypothetical protein
MKCSKEMLKDIRKKLFFHLFYFKFLRKFFKRNFFEKNDNKIKIYVIGYGNAHIVRSALKEQVNYLLQFIPKI